MFHCLYYSVAFNESKEKSRAVRSRDFEKGGALCADHHVWPTKKILGFRWSKKAKITLETTAFG